MDATAGRANAVLSSVARRIEDLSEGRFDFAVHSGDIVACTTRMGKQRLLLADCGSCRLRMRLSLNVPEADVIHILFDEATGMPWMKSLNFWEIYSITCMSLTASKEFLLTLKYCTASEAMALVSDIILAIGRPTVRLCAWRRGSASELSIEDTFGSVLSQVSPGDLFIYVACGSIVNIWYCCAQCVSQNIIDKVQIAVHCNCKPWASQIGNLNPCSSIVGYLRRPAYWMAYYAYIRYIQLW